MKTFLKMLSAIIIIVIVISHAKKQRDMAMAYDSKDLIWLCGKYLGQQHHRNSRGSETKSINILSNGKKQEFGLVDFTRISIEKMHIGMNICVGYTDFFGFFGVPYAIEINEQ
jgi:hypothetical protein